MSTITSIYSKRINSSALVLVHYNGTLIRVLLNAGKRVEFADWKSANAKAWHIKQAGVMGFEWSRYMTRKEFDARVAALRDQPVKEYIDNSEEDQDTDAPDDIDDECYQAQLAL